MDKLTTSLAWLLRAICLLNDIAIFTNQDKLVSILLTITMGISCALCTDNPKSRYERIDASHSRNTQTKYHHVKPCCDIFFLASVAVANTWLLMIGIAGVIIALLDVFLPWQSKAN